MKYFKFKFLMVLLALAAAIPPAGAQNEVTVCDGTTTTGYLPVYGYYFEQAQHNQMLYPQSELSELPEGCFITSITLYPTSALAFSGVDVTISLANLNSAAPFQVDGYGYSNALDVTVEPVATVTPAGQTILTIELEEPFQYDGGDLLIDVTTPDGGSYGSTSFTAKNVSDYYGFYSYGTTKKAIKYLPKLTLAYNVESKPYAAKVSPKSIDFGKVAPNSSHTENVTIKNTGGNAITPTLSGLDAPFSTTYTPATLAAGETATIPIEFNPTNAGTFNSTLHIGAVESEDIDLDVTLTGLAAYELTVCDGTTENSYLPVYGLYVDEYAQNNQMIYPAEMLQGINGKAITSMTFYLKSGINFATTATFSLKNLAANTPEYESTPVAIEGYTAVKTVEVVKNSSLSEWTITFDQPFVYNGGDLLVNVETTADSYGTTYFYGVGQTTYQSFYTSNRNGSKTRSKFLPKVTFTFEDSGETPVVNVDAPVFNPEDGTTFEENLTVSLTCATAGATIKYSYNGEYFTDYTEPITIDETTTIYAKAVLGTNESQVVQATYTKEAAPQPSTNEYVLVTDVADLAVGKHIIFVNKESAKAMSSTQNGNNRGATEITIASDVATATEATEIFTLEQEQVEDAYYWLFKASKTPGYIYAAGANSNNYLRTEETADNKAQATIEIASNGEATVTFNAGTRNTMMYNSGSDIFACYASSSTQQPVYIFIEKSGDTPQPTPQVATPTFSVEAGEYTEAQNVTITCATEGATIHYTVDGTDPTAESPVYNEAIAVGETMTIKAIAVKEGMTDSEIASATYTINIPSGEGTTFVKVTAADQLVAGKRYIIVSGNKAMGTAPTGNFLTAIDITGGDEVTVSGNSVAIMTLGGTQGHYTLALGDNYLHATSSSTNLNFGTSTEWAIADYNGTLDGYRVKHADANRAVRYQSGNNRFGNYSTSDDNSVYAWIYVEKSNEPVVPELTVALDPAEKTYTVGQEAKIMVNVENGNDDTMVSYKINDGEEQDYNAETGIVLPNNKAKEYTVTVYATDGEHEATATGTYSFTAAPAFEVTLTPNKEGNYTVGDEAIVTVAVDKYIGEEYLVTYTIGDSEEQIEYNAQTGIVLPNDKAGDVTVKVYVTDGYDHAEQEYTATYHFDAAPAIVVTLDPASGSYFIGEQVTVTVTAENTIGDYEVTYKIGDGEEFEYEDGITITSDQEGTVNLTVTVVDGYHDDAATATGAYTFVLRPVVEAPTFSLVAGSYTGAQTLNISCATEGAIILYSTNGGETWTEGNTVNVNEDMTIMAKATKDGYNESEVVSAYYIIDIPAELPTIEPFDGYYKVKNLGNNKYANIAGRKTLNFTNDIDQMAGTVIRIKTDNHGKVLSLRSQAADLQGYADRAMNYVPTFVHLVAEKLDAEGVGELFGETGIDAILEKFNESFDAHLYVEPAEGGFRLYGKTPSMQPVVDFYRDNKAKVEAKLPMLETAINNAIDKILEKTNGSGASILEHFSLHTIWQNMGGTLTEPVDDASTMEFYRQVLNNKNYVWDFAYETAMIYWTNLKNHPKYETTIKPALGEYADYLEKIENVRPDFKYYIVQDNDKPDFISQGNADILNNAGRTIWSVEPRTDFTVNIPEENDVRGEYVTTLYTDFAYDLPEGVTAYKVTGISDLGAAELDAISGTVPAQTPVLLKATAAGDKVLTLNTNDGTVPTDNLLVGPDYLINTYSIKTEQVVNMFEIVKGIFGETFYNNYLAEYEYLMLKYSGLVNNKYFWGLPYDDVKNCTYMNGDEAECVVRSLDVQDGIVGFYDNVTVSTNKAFLVNEQFNPITLTLRGDINRDGKINISDVTALIDILLAWPEKPYVVEYDYIAADFNESGNINITDVTVLIDYLLSKDLMPSSQNGD